MGSRVLPIKINPYPTALSAIPGFPSTFTHHECLPEGEVCEEDVILQDVADLPLQVFVEQLSVQEDVTGVWLQPTGQHVQQGCLAGTCGQSNVVTSHHNSRL